MENIGVLIAILGICLGLILQGQSLTMKPVNRKYWGNAISIIALVYFILVLLFLFNPQLPKEIWVYIVTFGMAILVIFEGILIFKFNKDISKK